MVERRDIHLLWEGAQSSLEAQALLRQRHAVELQLPADYHHALLVHLSPPGLERSGQLDITGGSELLGQVAEIRGLAEIAELIEAAAGAEVHIQSPAPSIGIRFPA
ncbi:hypothetical protein QVG61_04795 [Thiohalobacter sp. IOR34]|uniref:hypothetical protein n=1 Tax=Thiohalobacter sp. IOR34 TaxID=3057176 RepID=UPI0025B23A9C|nr:hypothetical protein [Thiohalobacter sp. IOR34]WJW76417.1 hypothetical protein QVG61_04795 [Thiohalobacter sp. IOR34]